MVTSAGLDMFEKFTEISAESWDRVIAVNLTGTFHCLQAAVPDMLAGGWGRIVTISSSSAQSGAARMAHYVASKGGVIALTRALAVEYAANGITVNTIPPAVIDTPMVRRAEAAGDVPSIDAIAARTPVRRAGTPDDIAAACAFLCSEDAGYITGQIIGVNGGWCDMTAPRVAPIPVEQWGDDDARPSKWGFRAPHRASSRPAPTRCRRRTWSAR